MSFEVTTAPAFAEPNFPKLAAAPVAPITPPAAPATTPPAAPATTPPAAPATTPPAAPATTPPAAPAAPVIPEKYEIKLPEGVQPDTKLIEQITPIAKAAGLTNEHLQKLAETYHAHIQAGYNAAVEAQTKQIQAWNQEIKSDPNSPLVLANAKRALSNLDKNTQAFFLAHPEVTDNPLVVRALAKFGAMFKEDGVPEGGTRTDAPATAAAKEMYNKSGMNP